MIEENDGRRIANDHEIGQFPVLVFDRVERQKHYFARKIQVGRGGSCVETDEARDELGFEEADVLGEEARDRVFFDRVLLDGRLKHSPNIMRIRFISY